MDELKDRLSDLDRLTTPTDWAQVWARSPRHDLQVDGPADGRSTRQRITAAVVAFAVFGAAGAFAWLAFGRSSTTAVKNPVLSSRPISVSALDRRGQIRCTATFPADQVAPGAQAGVAFTVENLSDHQIEIPEGAGNGATGYLVERSADGTLLQDTSSRHSGTIGGYPMPRPVAPGATFDLPAYDAPLLWPGTIEITPMCPIGRDPKGIMLPEVQITVATSGSAPDSAEAVTSAVHAVSPDFDDCAPRDTADAVVGSVHGYAARCQALVIPKDGFDIVVLAAYAPVTAAPTDLSPLAYEIQAVPVIKLSGSESVSWRVVVVTSSGAHAVNGGGVASNCDGNSYEAGGPFIRCDQPTAQS